MPTINTLEQCVQSWAQEGGKVHSTEELLEWIHTLNAKTHVHIEKIALSQDPVWRYWEEDGVIANKSRSFFTISGLQQVEAGQVLKEQPIIIQDEIGYLGIICKNINGILHFLLQAKIEPGNINHVQISPTIQATKSNFMQMHGGSKPAYLDYFLHANKYEIIADQLQSEQSSRFLRKRNRNIIIMVNDEVAISDNHRWMTLGQIKELMCYNNLVNMDTRTVLSCIPFWMLSEEPMGNDLESYFKDSSLYKSIFTPGDRLSLPHVYKQINDYKMFDERKTKLVPLLSLPSWQMRDKEFVSTSPFHFKIVFCDITIEGREVKHWTQPLFAAVGMASFGLISSNICGKKRFLVRMYPEVGCFDHIELGPTVQLEATEVPDRGDPISQFFFEAMDHPEMITQNVILSEEGGRFYYEQNRNIILEVPFEDVPPAPKDYFWLDYKTLNQLTQINNCLNIQLRNLLSLLKA